MISRRLVLIILFSIAVGCNSSSNNPATTTHDHSNPSTASGANKVSTSDYEVAEVFSGLRDQVLQLKPAAIGNADGDESTVIAVLMESGLPKAVVSLVAIVDGSASLYFSNGGGIIGAGEHEPVRKVSAEFITLAQQSTLKFTLTGSFPLPHQDNVRFYLVTGGGVYTFEALEDDLGNSRHPCSVLFHKGHELIAAIRENTPE